MSDPEQLALFRLPPAVARPKPRHFLIAGRIVPYVLGQARRRLSMRIDERGLRIAAPRGTPAETIEAFVLDHGDWVLRKLDEYVDRTLPRQVRVRDGATLPVLGGEVTLRVAAAAGNRVHWDGDCLRLFASPGADLDALARRGLQRRALEFFAGRLTALAGQGGIPVPPLSLSSARTRWGSCSRRSGIRLNWRLIHLPPAPIDYVVAHELAHLAEMNHSPRFWAEVERLFPDWRAASNELRWLAKTLPLL